MIELTEAERQRVLIWAHICASESKLFYEDHPLVAKLGGYVDAHEVTDVSGEILGKRNTGTGL